VPRSSTKRLKEMSPSLRAAKVQGHARRSAAGNDDALALVSGGDRSDLSDRIRAGQTSAAFGRLAFPFQSQKRRGERRQMSYNIGFLDASLTATSCKFEPSTSRHGNPADWNIPPQLIALHKPTNLRVPAGRNSQDGQMRSADQEREALPSPADLSTGMRRSATLYG
jgi:hypothetical protein